MNELISKLGPKAQRGSKPRCHLMLHGSKEEVAARLSELASPWGVVSATDKWMPNGFEDLEECQLHKPSPVLSSALNQTLEDWWLEPASKRAMTPNIDIASTCVIDGKPGLLLVEAKAHFDELTNESAGRRLDPSTPERAASHEKIGRAIDQAARELSGCSGQQIKISRDLCYQMSNRFAWSWKLASEGIPVVLIYLGFLGANEMALPINSADDWRAAVQEHSEPLFPQTIWNTRLDVAGTPLIPAIRVVRQEID